MLARPRQLFLECTPNVRSDANLERLLLRPLEAPGYRLSHAVRDAHVWGEIRRSRWSFLASLIEAEYDDFYEPPPPPDRRNPALSLGAALFPSRRAAAVDLYAAAVDRRAGEFRILHALRGRSVATARAPRWAYDAARRCKMIAARAALAGLVPDRRSGLSSAVNYQF